MSAGEGKTYRKLHGVVNFRMIELYRFLRYYFVIKMFYDEINSLYHFPEDFTVIFCVPKSTGTRPNLGWKPSAHSKLSRRGHTKKPVTFTPSFLAGSTYSQFLYIPYFYLPVSFKILPRLAFNFLKEKMQFPGVRMLTDFAAVTCFLLNKTQLVPVH